jgi:hypothetical protein
LLTLDELARRIQVESIAWTYLTGLGLAPVLVGVFGALNLHPSLFNGILTASGLDPHMFDFMLPYFYVLLLEQTRTLWLYKVSRQY